MTAATTPASTAPRDGVYTCLWFADNNGHVAMNFYVDLFRKAGREAHIVEYSEGNIAGVFQLDQHKIMFLNGGDKYRLSPATSLVVNCNDQKEIDFFWDALTAGNGRESRCGWCDDQFGVSWQVVPKNLGDFLSRPGGMEAMMKMQKMSIPDFEAAIAAATAAAAPAA